MNQSRGQDHGSGHGSARLWLVTHWPAIIVWGLVAIYIAFFGILTVLQHDAFQTTAFDLGNVDQAVWNTRHGRPFAMTNIEGLKNRLGTHVEPILLPISVLYFVWSDPRTLLLLQTVVLALGAWPIYLLSRCAFRKAADDEASGGSHTPLFANQVLPILFSLVYLLFPALQSANVFDFHAVALAPTFFLFALYFLEKERWGAYALFAVLTMSCKEDMPLLVAMLGLYAIIVRRRAIIGLLTIAVAATWFFVAIGWIMPHFDTRGVSPLANRYDFLGDSPVEMAKTMITQPGIVLGRLFTEQNLAYVVALLTPVAFLSLFAPQVLMLALPPLFVNLLSTDGFMHQLEGFHYGVTLVPAFVVSAAYGAAWLCRKLNRARPLPYLLAAAVLIATLVYHHGHGYTPLAASYSRGWPQVTDHHKLGEEMADSIPTEASLAALPHPNPHASQRQQLSMIDRVENGLPAPIYDAELIWMDVTNGWPLHPNDLKTSVDNLLDGDYGIAQATDGWLLLGQGEPAKTLPDAFYSFARSDAPQPQYAMQLEFLFDGEPVLESLGFDLEHDPQAETSSLTFYWRALQPLPPNLRLYPFYFDDATGTILEDTSLRPLIATIWYPSDHWQIGEVVTTRTLPWDVDTTFSVGLGVMQGNDWQNADGRLPIRIESSDLVIRLMEGDTWARLLHVTEGKSVQEFRQFSEPEPKEPLYADFGGEILLLGYEIDCSQKNSSCNLQLYWQAQTRMDTSYTVFAQAIAPSGQVQAQVDSIPQWGGYPTTWWLPGEVVVDSLALNLPRDADDQDNYRLIVGLYDAATGTRLPVTGAATDYVSLPTIQP